jgi:hypothetical protein
MVSTRRLGVSYTYQSVILKLTMKLYYNLSTVRDSNLYE